MRKNIRITNPVSGPGFTSLNRAKRFVKHGDAEWVQPGISIRFVRNPCNSREQSVLQNARIAPYWYERASHEGIARINALANTPVIEWDGELVATEIVGVIRSERIGEPGAPDGPAVYTP